jgi:hypothetical protein
LTSSWADKDLAYFAGIIDGEGCFCLHNHGTHRFGAQLQVGNTDPRLLEWIQSRFGGSVNMERRTNKAHKPVWRWIAHVDNLTELITAILPFLIVKRDQADLMLAYRRTLAPKISTGRSTTKTPESVKRERSQIHLQLSTLNRRGTRL